MKNIEVPDDVYAALAQIAKANHLAPADVLSALLNPPAGAPADHAIARELLTPEFRDQPAPDDRYLAVLSWIAIHHATEFAEYIEREPSAATYLRFTREQIARTCRDHLSRQIDGTRYWAIMNITTGQKRRFVTKLLDFVGYEAPVAELVCSAIGIGGIRSRRALLVA